MDITKFTDTISKIDGFLTIDEGKLLFDLAKKVNKKVIVEIGSWKGKSTICLGLGSKEGLQSKIYAIDPHVGSSEHQDEYNGKVWTFDIFKENIRKAGVENLVVPIIKVAEEVVKDFNEEIGLIFIDGAHEYDAVKKDFQDWFPKVTEGGIIALHDTIGWSGPRRVAEEFLYNSSLFSHIGFVDSITYGQKVSKNTLYDRILNKRTLFLRNFSEQVRSLPIPKSIKRGGKKVVSLWTDTLKRS